MEIILSSIGDKGDINNERIGFKVLKDCELKYFLVFRTEKTANGFAHISEDAYWFTPQEVKVNDRIVLYTKNGNESEAKNSDGGTTYFFYWGLSKAIFKKDSDRIVLASLNTWKLLP